MFSTIKYFQLLSSAESCHSANNINYYPYDFSKHVTLLMSSEIYD